VSILVVRAATALEAAAAATSRFSLKLISTSLRALSSAISWSLNSGNV